VQFIGPNSPNTSTTIIPRDRNNFGPAIGFAWQVPWFGAGKTTVRGGYQVTFQRVNMVKPRSFNGGWFSTKPRVKTTPPFLPLPGGQLNRAVLLSDLPALVPVGHSARATVPVYGGQFLRLSVQFAALYRICCCR
jgi:hypothetical protein